MGHQVVHQLGTLLSRFILLHSQVNWLLLNTIAIYRIARIDAILFLLLILIWLLAWPLDGLWGHIRISGLS